MQYRFYLRGAILQSEECPPMFSGELWTIFACSRNTKFLTILTVWLQSSMRRSSSIKLTLIEQRISEQVQSLTFVEDRSDVQYSLLPDRQTMDQVCKSVLDYMKKSNSLKMLIPSEYFHQIIEHGRTIFDECGVWKSIFVNANGSVMCPCWSSIPQTIRIAF